MDKTYKTLADAAIGLNRSAQQMGVYIKRGMPRAGDGSLDHDTCVQWIAANIKHSKETKAAKVDWDVTERDLDRMLDIETERPPEPSIVQRFGHQLLDPRDTLHYAMAGSCTPAERRALMIDVVQFVAELTADRGGPDPAEELALLGVSREEIEQLPGLLQRINGRLGVPER